jgi:hypothetical protein
LELTLGAFAPQRRREQLTYRVFDQGVRVAGAAEALAGGVSKHLSAVGVDDDHAVLECRQRTGERLALGVGSPLEAVRLRRCCSWRANAPQLTPERPYRE